MHRRGTGSVADFQPLVSPAHSSVQAHYPGSKWLAGRPVALPAVLPVWFSCVSWRAHTSRSLTQRASRPELQPVFSGPNTRPWPLPEQKACIARACIGPQWLWPEPELCLPLPFASADLPVYSTACELPRPSPVSIGYLSLLRTEHAPGLPAVPWVQRRSAIPAAELPKLPAP